jgi:hypothetical protein
MLPGGHLAVKKQTRAQAGAIRRPCHFRTRRNKRLERFTLRGQRNVDAQ